MLSDFSLLVSEPLYYSTRRLAVTMGRRKDLTTEEKKRILNLSREGASVREIARLTNRCAATVSKILRDPYKRRTRTEKRHYRKVTAYQLRAVKRAASRNPLATSQEIFEDAGVLGMPKTTRNRIMRVFAKLIKPSRRPPLTQKHINRRLEWARDYMKVNFDHVIWRPWTAQMGGAEDGCVTACSF